jgi:hypothetical protein
LETLLDAGEAILGGPTLRVFDISEHQRRMEYLPGLDGSAKIKEGIWRLVRISDFDEDRFNFPNRTISNRKVAALDDETREQQRTTILQDRDACWYRPPFFLPKPETFTCLCGETDRWLTRTWLFHDYDEQGDDPRAHRFRYRVDIGLKCQHCGMVTPPFGIVLTEQEWETHNLTPRQYTWRDLEG